MSTALNRQQRPEQQIDVQTTYEPKYQEFTEISSQQLEFEDVVFFARIAIFAISTVLICFMLLVQNVSTFWSFSLALLISTAVVAGASYLYEYLKKD